MALQRDGLDRTLRGVDDVRVEDAEMWRAVLGNDAKAFTRLFRAHRDRVFRHAARLVDSSAEADDVAAAAFFELWRRRSAVTLVAGSPVPWLLATTTNLARNARRGTARYRAVLNRLPRSAELTDPAEQALERIERARDESGVRTAMHRLSKIDLNLLVLTALEGLSVQEASAVLELKEGTARSRLSRARQRLRGVLTDRDLSTELMTEEA